MHPSVDDVVFQVSKAAFDGFVVLNSQTLRSTCSRVRAQESFARWSALRWMSLNLASKCKGHSVYGLTVGFWTGSQRYTRCLCNKQSTFAAASHESFVVSDTDACCVSFVVIVHSWYVNFRLACVWSSARSSAGSTLMTLRMASREKTVLDTFKCLLSTG